MLELKQAELQCELPATGTSACWLAWHFGNPEDGDGTNTIVHMWKDFAAVATGWIPLGQGGLRAQNWR